MPYPEQICAPMREDLTSAGFEELRTADDVTKVLPGGGETLLVVVNSVCGCAAGNARPGVKLALANGKKTTKIIHCFCRPGS